MVSELLDGTRHGPRVRGHLIHRTVSVESNANLSGRLGSVFEFMVVYGNSNVGLPLAIFSVFGVTVQLPTC